MPFNVLLTGSTGNLGAYLLDNLIGDKHVGRIVCLNRSADASNRQRAAHQTRDLVREFDADRVRFLRADLGSNSLGLEEKTYLELTQTTDLVIHNAWPVDFNLHVRSFKSSIDGVMNLIRFCQSRAERKEDTKSIKLLFISTFAAVSNWGAAAPSSRSQVPEVELADWKVSRTGYGQSKLLSERLLCQAASSNSLPVTIVRVGQLCGPVSHGVSGKWPEQEWVPSIIKSSITMNALPATLGVTEALDWVPVDIAARVILEISSAFNQKKSRKGIHGEGENWTTPDFFHLVNPRRAKWSELVATIRLYLPSLALVSFTHWVDRLRESVEEAGGFQGVDEGLNPAGKLMDFFEHLQDRTIRFPHARVPTLATKQTRKISETLDQLGPVNVEWMDLWMRQWSWTEQKLEQSTV